MNACNSCMKQAHFVLIIAQNSSGNARVRKMQSSSAGRLRRCSHLCLISMEVGCYNFYNDKMLNRLYNHTARKLSI